MHNTPFKLWNNVEITGLNCFNVASVGTKIVSSNPAHSELYTIQHFVIKDLYPGTPVPSTNKADRHDINEIYLKLVLRNILYFSTDDCHSFNFISI
jgi:hypothetical protein